MAVRLYGLTHSDEHGAESLPPDVQTIRVRDLVAICSDAPFAPVAADDATVASHHRVVDSLFAARTLLPAPPGVTFRTAQALQRWMELHYVALSEGLAFVDDRAGARVHIVRADASPAARDAGTDLATAAAECMRALRRQAVAGLPLRSEEHTS